MGLTPNQEKAAEYLENIAGGVVNAVVASWCVYLGMSRMQRVVARIDWATLKHVSDAARIQLETGEQQPMAPPGVPPVG
jgi:hypothetical protein